MTNDQPASALPERVRRARLSRPWSQAALAVAAGVNEKTVRRLESGAAVSAETALAVCAALGIAYQVGAPAPTGGNALPEVGGSRGTTLEALANLAAPGATVMAVDIAAYLGQALGDAYRPGDEDPCGGDDPAISVSEGMFGVVAVVLVVALAILFMTFAPALAMLLLARAGLSPSLDLVSWITLAVGSALGLFAYSRWIGREDTGAAKARDYAREVCRTVFSVEARSVSLIELDAGGGARVRPVPLLGRGHAAVPVGAGHLTFSFAHPGGTLEVPYVPRTPASEALAASLA